jgi:hypothetical protein
MADALKFEHPFTLIIAGPTSSGKTSFCLKFLQHLQSLCSETSFAGGIIWCYSENTAVHRQDLQNLHKNVSYHDGVPEEFGDAQGRASLIILDDLLNQVYSQNVCDLFTKGSHHRNTSVILYTQNLFHQGRHCRDISLNAKYLVPLKNTRDKNQFTFFARQVYPEHSHSLYEAYLDATKRPHGYIILVFGKNTNDLLRFRTNVLPDQYPPIIYANVGQETNTVLLPHPKSFKDGKTKIKKRYNTQFKPRTFESYS